MYEDDVFSIMKSIKYFNYFNNKLEKYRKICEAILKKQLREEYTKLIKYYRKNPLEFAEQFLGTQVKLKWYQKLMLKVLYTKERMRL